MKFPLRRLAIASLLAALVCQIASSAIPSKLSYRYDRTPSGKLDTRYHDGNDGTPAIPLAWQAPLPISLLTTDTGSVNLCATYLTQPAPPDDDATITVESGFTLPPDFSLGGTNNCVLSWSTPPAVSSSVKFRAALAGVNPAVSGEFQLTVTAPPSGDTTAPPYPVALTCVNGVGNAVCSWDASIDNYEADGDAPSGTDYYEVCLGGAGCQQVAAATITARQLTATTIGSPSPAPSSSQTGNSWQIVSAGDIDGADDQMRFVGAQVSGDFTFTFKIGTVTNNGATFPKYGAIIRNSLTDGVRQSTCHNQLGTTSQMRRRATDAGSMGGVASATLSTPAWYRFTRVGNVETCETSTDGNSFVGFGTYGDTYDATPHVGLFVVGAAGVASTGNYENVNLSTLPRVTYQYNTTSAGNITVRAHDVAGNWSAASAAVAIVPSAPADTTAPIFSVQPSGNANSSQTSINWSCGTATDANGIRGYIPSTCGTTSSCAGSVDQAEQASPSFTQLSLSSGTTYYLRCKAVDPSGNISSYSTIASATTAGSAPPAFTAPTVSSVTALSQTSLRITHSAVAGADHYLLREATTVGGTYTILTQFDHGALTVDRTGLTTGSTRCYQVAAANADESTIGPWTTTGVCGTTQVSTGAIAWHPGHYTWVHYSFDWRQAGVVSLILGAIDQIAADTTVKGILLRQRWAAMEGPNAGDYSAGFAAMDQILARAALRGKRVALAVHAIQFGGYGGASGLPTIFPQYVVDNADGTLGVTPFNIPDRQAGVTARVWQQGTTDRLIAMAQAYGGRYGGTSGNAAYFEWYEPGSESALTVALGTDGYTVPALVTQTKRLYTGARAAFQLKGIRWHANYLGDDSQMKDVLEHCAQLGCMIGGPDVNPWEHIQANEVYVGIRGTPLKDYRLVTPFAAEVQSPELCGYEGSATPTQLYQYAMTGDNDINTIVGVPPTRAHYFVWYRNIGECWLDSPTNTQPDYVRRWTNPAQTIGILPFIRTNPTPAIITTCPTSYTQGCNTSSIIEPASFRQRLERQKLSPTREYRMAA